MKKQERIILILISILIVFSVLAVFTYFKQLNGELGIVHDGVIRPNIISSATMLPKSESTIPVKVPPATLPTLSASSNCDCSFAISSETNVEFLVTDPSGQQTGYLQASTSYVNNIVSASYGIEPGIVDDTGKSSSLPETLVFQANNPENGIYKIQVTGKEAGKYHFNVGIVYGPTNGKSASFEGKLEINQVDTYSISFPDGRIQKNN